MKKLLCVFISLAMLISMLSFATIVSAKSLEKVFDQTELQNTIQSCANGIVQHVNGGVRIAGRTLDNTVDDYLFTYGLANDATITDFVVEYDFTPSRVDWNIDRFYFHNSVLQNENGYVFGTDGSMSGLGVYLSLANQEWGTHLADCSVVLTAGTTYHVKLSMTGKDIECYFYDKSGEVPSTPTMAVTVPDTELDPFVPSGDFNFSSWGGDFFIKDMQISNGSTVYVSNDILPTISSANDGMIQYIHDDVRIVGQNETLSGDEYLFIRGLANDTTITDFVVEFDYTAARHDWTLERFFFHNSLISNENGYVLGMDGSMNGNDVYLCLDNQEWGTHLADCSVAIVVGTTYHIKLSMTGKDIECYIYDKSGEVPSTPTMAVTVPDTETDPFVPTGDFNYSSWGGDITLSNMTIMAQKATTPQLPDETIFTYDVSPSNVITGFLPDKNTADFLDGVTLAEGSTIKILDELGTDKSSPKKVFDQTDLQNNTIQLQEESNGIVEYVEGGVRLAGIKPDLSGDAYLLTKGLANDTTIADFVTEFDITPSRDDWSLDKLFFHSTSTVATESAYVFGMDGSVLGNDVYICLPNHAWDTHLVDCSVDIVAGTTYHVKLSMTGKDIECYVYDKSGEVPSTPTMAVTVPDTETDPFISSGDFNFVSWGGDFIISNMTIIDQTPSAIGTGFKAEVTSLGAEVYNYYSYTIVIKGDVTGDGAIDISDLAAVKQHLLHINTLVGSYLTAGYVNSDGAISISDLLAVQKHILGITTIVQ